MNAKFERGYQIFSARIIPIKMNIKASELVKTFVMDKRLVKKIRRNNASNSALIRFLPRKILIYKEMGTNIINR